MALKKREYDEKFATTAYALKLIAGEIVCCDKELQLAKKHIRDLKRAGTPSFPYVFDVTRAKAFFNFFESCINPDNGQFYKILPHQQFENGMLFGWVHKDTGVRKYTTVYQQEARGQSKTTVSAIRAMFCLCADKIYKPNSTIDTIKKTRPVYNAQIYLMAVDKDQVKELRNPIVDISKLSPAINHYIDAKSTKIKGKIHSGEIYVLSRDMNNKDGGKPTVVVVDEFAKHPNRQRYEMIKRGFGKKEQSLLIIITTPADNEITNPAKLEYDYATKVLYNKLDIPDERYLPIIREVEPKDKLSDKTVWQKSNPMFRYPKNPYSQTLLEWVTAEYNQAFSGDDPENRRLFRIYRMAQWQERSVNSYLSEKLLKQFYSLQVSQSEFEQLTYGLPMNIGADFAIRRDLTAIGYVYYLDDGRVAIDCHGYAIDDYVIEKELSDKVPYRQWAEQGWMTLLHEYMHKDIVAQEMLDRAGINDNRIVMACFDQAQVEDLMHDLKNGVYGDGIFNENNIIAIRQRAIDLNSPTVLLKNLIIEGKLVWNGNPLLKWCLMNCFEFQSTTNGMIMLGKENKDSCRRIDGVAAIINALHQIDKLKNLQDNLVNRILGKGWSL